MVRQCFAVPQRHAGCTSLQVIHADQWQGGRAPPNKQLLLHMSAPQRCCVKNRASRLARATLVAFLRQPASLVVPFVCRAACSRTCTARGWQRLLARCAMRRTAGCVQAGSRLGELCRWLLGTSCSNCSWPASAGQPAVAGIRRAAAPHRNLTCHCCRGHDGSVHGSLHNARCFPPGPVQVVVDEERACPHCHLRLGGKVFVVLQPGMLPAAEPGSSGSGGNGAGAAAGTAAAAGEGGGVRAGGSTLPLAHRQQQQQQPQQQPQQESEEPEGLRPPGNDGLAAAVRRLQQQLASGQAPQVLCYACYRRLAGSAGAGSPGSSGTLLPSAPAEAIS